MTIWSSAQCRKSDFFTVVTLKQLVFNNCDLKVTLTSSNKNFYFIICLLLVLDHVEHPPYKWMNCYYGNDKVSDWACYVLQPWLQLKSADQLD